MVRTELLHNSDLREVGFHSPFSRIWEQIRSHKEADNTGYQILNREIKYLKQHMLAGHEYSFAEAVGKDTEFSGILRSGEILKISEGELKKLLVERGRDEKYFSWDPDDVFTTTLEAMDINESGNITLKSAVHLDRKDENSVFITTHGFRDDGSRALITHKLKPVTPYYLGLLEFPIQSGVDVLLSEPFTDFTFQTSQ